MTRITEIDNAKYLASVLMFIFHFFYAFELAKIPIISTDNFVMELFATISHSIYITIFGINLSLTYEKYKNKDKQLYFEKQKEKFINLVTMAVFSTAVSYIFFPSKYIKFGIFHFFALATLVAQPFIRYKLLTILGIIGFSLLEILINTKHKFFKSICANNSFICLIMGLYEGRFTAIDHFYFIPFFIMVLIGIFISQQVYSKNKRLIHSDEDKKSYIAELLSKHSLKFYIIHWILIITIIFSLKTFVYSS